MDFNLTVWKYILESSPDVQRIEMVEGARVLDVGEQGGALCLWALVDPAAQTTETRLFRIAGTGHPLKGDVDPGTNYAGRAEFANGALQVHVFDLGPEVETGDELRARIMGDYQAEKARLATDGDGGD